MAAVNLRRGEVVPPIGRSSQMTTTSKVDEALGGLAGPLIEQATRTTTVLDGCTTP